MHPFQHSQHCPRCGAPTVPAAIDPFTSAECAFVFYTNAGSAVAGLLRDENGRLLLLRRSRDPGKGLLTLPGGFINAGETAEEALAREVREETGLEITGRRYLASFPHQYPYRDVTYATLDLFFVCQVRSWRELQPLDETEEILLLPPDAVPADDIAFPSVRNAVALFARETA